MAEIQGDGAVRATLKKKKKTFAIVLVPPLKSEKEVESKVRGRKEKGAHLFSCLFILNRLPCCRFISHARHFE